MKKTRFTEEQMVKILRETDKTPVAEVAKRHGVSDVTIYAWRKRFGGLEAADVKRLRQLEQENARRVQDQDPVQRLGQHGIGRVGIARRTEHHVQKVRRIVEIVARVHKGLADGVLVGHGHDGRHLGDQADCRDQPVFRVVDVQGVVIEGRQRANHANQNGHGVSILAAASRPGKTGKKKDRLVS